MVGVSQLGYLGIGTSDAKAWQDLATTILGLQVVPGDDKSAAYLRMDEYHHRLELRSNGTVESCQHGQYQKSDMAEAGGCYYTWTVFWVHCGFG